MKKEFVRGGGVIPCWSLTQSVGFRYGWRDYCKRGQAITDGEIIQIVIDQELRLTRVLIIARP